MTIAIFSIDMPPSLNNIFYNRPRKGRAKTTSYKTWIETAIKQIRFIERVPPFLGPVKVSLIIERDNALSDLDNRIKPVLDVLQQSYVIENDRLVIELGARWGDVKGCVVTVTGAAA